jgi:hypothetical protein
MPVPWLIEGKSKKPFTREDTEEHKGQDCQNRRIAQSEN